MNYIINPMWFYWIQVCDFFKNATGFIGLFLGIFAALLLCIIVFDMWKEENIPLAKSRLRLLSILTILFCLASAFIPSRDTLIEMQVAKYATNENAEWTVETIKSTVDYVVEAIKSLK